MIFAADMKVRFSGTDRDAQATAFLDECPPGSVRYLGADKVLPDTVVVKVLRSLKIGVLGIADPSERKAARPRVIFFDQPPARRQSGSTLLALLIVVAFGGLGVLGAPGVEVLGKVPVTLAMAWPAFLAITETAMGGWVMALFAVCSGVGAVAGVISLFRPQPALHRQFAGREDHDKDIKEIKDSIASMKLDFEKWSSSHYEARRRMHRKINHISSAMAYLAGTLEQTQPTTAARLRTLIDKADEEDGDE